MPLLPSVCHTSATFSVPSFPLFGPIFICHLPSACFLSQFLSFMPTSKFVAIEFSNDFLWNCDIFLNFFSKLNTVFNFSTQLITTLLSLFPFFNNCFTSPPSPSPLSSDCKNAHDFPQWSQFVVVEKEVEIVHCFSKSSFLFHVFKQSLIIFVVQPSNNLRYFWSNKTDRAPAQFSPQHSK